MKHPRVWAILLIAVALPLFVVGYDYAILCHVPTVNGCTPHDATQGIAWLIIAGLIVVGAAMLLTTGRSHPVRVPVKR